MFDLDLYMSMHLTVKVKLLNLTIIHYNFVIIGRVVLRLREKDVTGEKTNFDFDFKV